MRKACGWLVLRVLYMVSASVCLSVGLCIPAYHVHNNYVTYIVAMRLDFSRLRQF